MFVDDDVHLLSSLVRAFRSKRDVWDMAFVESAEAALKAAAEDPFAVVVTDMSMPGMNGLELVRSLNERSPATQCVVLTGTADLQLAAEVINTARVFRFYTKPCPLGRLMSGIEETLTAMESAAPQTEIDTARPSDVGLLALDHIATAVIVVDGNGHVLHMNQAGSALVAEKDGLAVDTNLVCRGAMPDETQALLDVIRSQAAPKPNDDAITAVSLSRPSMRHPLLVIATPLGPESNADGHASVALFVTDPDRPPSLDADVIGRLYGLTGAESRLACALATGRDLGDAAEALHITPESARTYLKRIFAKTGARRQADLVRLILASPALVPHGKAGISGQPEQDGRA
ncbi:MAG: response regulator [Rhodospirillales bacterium]|jgi:DNA-binding NarL/FixJ family response regulator|nr:response regulator [Rhodospirillales bacterium]